MEDFEKVWAEIDKAQNILLTLHPKPDADSVGSNLAMMHALESLNKKVTVIAGDGPLPAYLKSAPGFEKIISKTIFEVEPKDYDLFLILDLSRLDRLTNKGEFVLPATWRTVCIDHHQGSTLMANVSWVDINMPAVGVMIYDLLKFRNIKLDHGIATNLILAIHGDTGSYVYDRVDSTLFTRLADLVQYVPDYTKVIFEIQNNLTPESLKFEALALSHVEVFSGFAIFCLDHSLLKDNNLLGEEHNGSFIANKLKAVVGWNIGASLTEAEPGFTRISLRTRDAVKYDVSKVAELIGGGGHKAAAATRIHAPLNEAKQKLIDAIRTLYPELV